MLTKMKLTEIEEFPYPGQLSREIHFLLYYEVHALSYRLCDNNKICEPLSWEIDDAIWDELWRGI